MGDVADMLGLAVPKTAPPNAADEAMKFLGDSKSKPAEGRQSSKTLKKPKGMKREVFDLLGKDGIVPAVQGSNSAGAFKTKRTIASKGKWVYVPIESSARNDNQLTFKHWIKADINYSDYPYAKFNVKLDKVVFSDEEYQMYLSDENWTKADTLALLETCHLYDLRWPVIFDRIRLNVAKSPEEIQNRFYSIVNKLHSVRDHTDKKLYDYDMEKEIKRRTQQDLMYKRTREEEQEELKLREELKMIDSTIKKNKKTNKSSANATTVSGDSNKVADTTLSATITNTGEVGGILLASVTNPMADHIPTPQAGKPCLQSSRLYLSDGSVPMAKSIITKMNSYLKELNIPERPVATKRVCDLVDQIRKDTILLISLHSSLKKKEKELITAKGGNIRNQGKSQPKGKQEKQEKADAKEKPDKPEKSRKGSSKKAAAVVATDIDDSALDALGGDLLPLDGKDEFGDLLDVFDSHDSFHDVEIKPVTKAAPVKKRSRASKADSKMDEPSDVVPPAKKKTKKANSNQ